jgi:hypothetical protein
VSRISNQTFNQLLLQGYHPLLAQLEDTTMNPTGTLDSEPLQSLIRHLLQFLDSLREDSWLIPTMRRSEDWLETLYDLWLQGTFINFREEEIFIFGAWVYAIMRLSTPTLFAN